MPELSTLVDTTTVAFTTGALRVVSGVFATAAQNATAQAAAVAAQATANTGVTNAATALAAAQAAQTTANTGVTNAATALAAAQAAQTTGDTGVTNSAAAQATANTAITNAATALAAAQAAQTTANTAVTNAATALAAAQAAQATANTGVANAATAQAAAVAAAADVVTHAALANPHTGAAPTSRTLTAGTGLTGGGTLAADRTFAADFGAIAGKVTEGNDARLTDARAPSGAASGQLGGTFPAPDVRGVRETSGPTLLTLGAVADGQVLTRSGLTLVGSAPGGVSDGDKGDITVSGGGAAWAIDPRAVTPAKMAAITTARVLGRTTAAAGDIEELTVGAGLSLAAGELGRPALTGDVTATADSNATTIAARVVTFAKTVAIATSRILGRTTAAAGDIEELTVGAGLSLAGGALGRPALTGDVTAAADSNATTIAARAVSFAKAQAIATARFLGRLTAGSGDVEELTSAQVATALMPRLLAPPSAMTTFDAQSPVPWAARSRMSWRCNMSAPSTGATFNFFGMSENSTGTRTTPALTSTNIKTCSKRTNFESLASANVSAGHVSAHNQGVGEVWRGNAARLGGFAIYCQFATDTTVATQRMFVGLAATSSAIPATSTMEDNVNCVFMGSRNGDANMSIMHNDAAGTCSRVDLGANFPTLNTAKVYEILLLAASNGSSIDYWARADKDDTTAVTGSLTTDIPANTVFLCLHASINNGGTAAAVDLDVMRWELQSP